MMSICLLNCVTAGVGISPQRELKGILQYLINYSVDIKVPLQRESESVLAFFGVNVWDT